MADGTGLTPEQKELVRKSWDIMKKDVKSNGVDLFLRLFKAHPNWQTYFKQFKDLTLDEVAVSPKMRAHGTTVMQSLTALVDNLDDIDCLLVLIEKIVRNHYPRGVDVEHYKNLKIVMTLWLVAHLGDALDDVTAESWSITVDTIIAVASQVIGKIGTENGTENGT